MNYGDYRVHIGFESTGIKRLIRIFDYLTLAMDGKIVFIDEMDSNINDVYLCKIVEFFKLYGKGQLCFTTHSTSPMEVLKDSKNSIDFLSSDSRIVPWKKNGNYTPESLYRRGMIEYLPFNIEAEDFLGILGD
jgi:AAA15 family ATPase/GTPase